MKTAGKANKYEGDRTTASAMSRNRSGKRGTFEFTDNRTSAAAQQKDNGGGEARFADNRETTRTQSKLQSIMVSDASMPLQRSIYIKNLPPSNKPLDSEEVSVLKKHHSTIPLKRQMLDRMHNNGKPPSFKFDSLKQLDIELKIRYEATKIVKGVDKAILFPSAKNPPHLDSNYWKNRGPVDSIFFVPKKPLPEGKNASDAIKAIFEPTDGKKACLDCWTTMVAVAYYAVMKGVGDKEFNQIHPGGAGLEISPRGTTSWPRSMGKSPIFNHYKVVSLTSSAELVPGDWVYFKNFYVYLLLHPGGPLQGENALYMGKYKGKEKFQGQSSSGLKTEEEMNKWLIEACYPNKADRIIHDIQELKREGGGLRLNNVKRPQQVKESKK